MPSWSKKTIQSTTYSFEHLDPEVITVSLDETVALRIRLSFSHHCYTVDFDSGAHTPDLACYGAAGDDRRAFDRDRYALTLGIKDFLKSVMTKKAYFSQRENFVVWKMVAPDGAQRKYAIFFSAERAANPDYDILMLVRSAYIKDQLPNNLDGIQFKTLFAKIHRGERILSPQVFQKHRPGKKRK